VNNQSDTSWDDGAFDQWCGFSFNRKMIELFGEAAKLTKLKAEQAPMEEINAQWDAFDRQCSMTFADHNTTDGEQMALRYSWLEMQDYIFSDSPTYARREQVMKWFNQWMDVRHLELEGIIAPSDS
jgi:hypothetical protein